MFGVWGFVFAVWCVVVSGLECVVCDFVFFVFGFKIRWFGVGCWVLSEWFWLCGVGCVVRGVVFLC